MFIKFSSHCAASNSSASVIRRAAAVRSVPQFKDSKVLTLWWIILFFLAVRACNQVQAKPGDSIPLPFAESAAMRLLYGTYDTQNGSNLSHLKLPTGIAGLYSSCNANAWRTFRYLEGGKHKYLLITHTPLKPCATSTDTLTSHADGEAIGAAVFSQEGDRCILEASNLVLMVKGNWGQAFDIDESEDPGCQPKIVNAGPLHHALILHDGTTGQGFTYLVQIYIVPVGHTLTFLKLAFHKDDGGMHDPPEFKTDTTVSFRPGTNPEYYDVYTSEHGFQIEGHKRLKINYNQTFVMKPDHYVRIRIAGKAPDY